MSGKRRFGRIRQLPSGRYQARYRGPDGVDRPAPYTFANKVDADGWLARVEGDIVNGTWRHPAGGKVPLGDYATTWLDQRNLRPRTAEIYRSMYRQHIEPTLGALLLSDISLAMVRAWQAHLAERGVSQGMRARTYWLLQVNICRRAVITCNPANPASTVSGCGWWACDTDNAASFWTRSRLAT